VGMKTLLMGMNDDEVMMVMMLMAGERDPLLVLDLDLVMVSVSERIAH